VALGLMLDEHVVVALNGVQISRDPQLPLVAGDALAFRAAEADG
jgi:molybdopterin-guanine dinucleotide biosynthesis protein A